MLKMFLSLHNLTKTNNKDKTSRSVLLVTCGLILFLLLQTHLISSPHLMPDHQEVALSWQMMCQLLIHVWVLMETETCEEKKSPCKLFQFQKLLAFFLFWDSSGRPVPSMGGMYIFLFAYSTCLQLSPFANFLHLHLLFLLSS